MKRSTLLTRLMLALLAVVFVLPAQAQPLIKHVPENAALYIGWRGSEDMGPDYEGSNLQGVIEETGLLEAIPQLVETFQKIGESEEFGDPMAAQLISMGGELWSSIWANGGAMYMLPPDANGPPIPRLAVLFKKGDGQAELKGALDKLVKMMNDAEQVPVFLTDAGDVYTLSIGFKPAQGALASLSTAARFKTASAKVQGDGALMVYIDVQEWIGQVDKFADMMRRRAQEWGEKDAFAEMWPTIRDASGLTGVKQLSMSAGIKDKNWHTKIYLNAPAPRKGVLSLIDNKPVKPSNLSHVPKTATYLQVFSMDPGKVLDVAREIMGAVEPGLVRQMDRGLAEASKEVGVSLEDELIKGMGPVWTVYIDPMVAGNGFSSLVMVNELSDAAAVEKALAKISDAANKGLDEAMEDAPMSIRLLTREVQGTKITHLGIPYVAPAYMVHNGRLFISLFPQGLEMAVEQSGKVEDSIVANATFGKSLKQFKRDTFTGLTFVDLPETAADGYGVNLMIMQTIAGAGEMFGGKASPMRMPPIGKVMPYIQPSGGLTWVDKDGMHMHSIEPFPGSSLLGPAKGVESMMAVSGPMAVAVLLPALGSAREAALQNQTFAYGQQIAVSAFAYSADHDGNLPDDIAKLREYVGFDDVFMTPRSMHAKEMPFNFGQWEQARQDAFIRQNSSFVLIPLGSMNDIEKPSETVMLFQHPEDTADDKLVVAWADGHVTSEDRDEVHDLIEAQTGKNTAQLIEAQVQIGQ